MSAKYVRKENWREPKADELDTIKQYGKGTLGKGILFFVPVFLIFAELIALEIFRFKDYPLAVSIVLLVITILIFGYFLFASIYVFIKDAVRSGEVEVLDARVTELRTAWYKYSGRTNVDLLVDGHIKKTIHVMNWNIRNIKVNDRVLIVRAKKGFVSTLRLCEGRNN